MPATLEHRVSRLETQTEVTEQVALIVYRDSEELTARLARTTAPVILAIPSNGRDVDAAR